MWKINHLWAILKTDGREWKILLECLIWGTPFRKPLSTYMCMYVCMYVCMYIYIYVDAQVK